MAANNADNADMGRLASAGDALCATTPTTADEAVDATAVVYGLAYRSLRRAQPDAPAPRRVAVRAHALPALAALGLTDPYAPLPHVPDVARPTRNRAGAAVHGTREGVEFHQSHRIPLCGQCRNWKNADERLGAPKEGA